MTFFVSVGALGYLAVIALAILYAFWPSLRYSHKRAKHLIDLTQNEDVVAPEYMDVNPADTPYAPLRRRTYKPFEDDYRDWRTQTFDSLSPEALDSTSNEGVD